MQEEIRGKLAQHDEATTSAWVGLSYGSIGVKWGPMHGPEAGVIMTKLLEHDPDRKIPFFCSLEFPATGDVFAEIVDWVGNVDDLPPNPRGPYRGGKGPSDSVAYVYGQDDVPLCYVSIDDVAGKDMSAAIARATLIAESLNKTLGHTP